MSRTIPRLAAKSTAVLVVAAGMTIGASSMASAGQIVTLDTGNQCSVVWQNDDGSYTDWWNQEN